MAITRGATKNYVLANGRIEFNKFPIENGVEQKAKAQGFRYLGASTEMNLTQENETLEHKSTECGFNVTDEEIITSSSLTGSFTLDNISTENLAMFFAGDAEKQTQTAATGKKEVVKLHPALGYRLGVDANNPNGVFDAVITKIETFANEDDAKTGNSVVATLQADVDYEFAPEMAYLMIGDRNTTTKVDVAGTWAVITYDIKQSMREVVITKNQSIVGSLMFRGCNAKGENRTYYLPKVRLSANGDFSLKGGTEWSTMGFKITALQEDGAAMLYINGQPKTQI